MVRILFLLSSSFLIVPILALMAVSCILSTNLEHLAYAQAGSNENQGFLVYNNTEFGISMEYPSDWQKAEPEHSQDSVVVDFTSPLQDDNDRYPETVNIAIENLTGSVTLDQYADASIKVLHDAFGSVDITESGATHLSNHPAYKLVYIPANQDIQLMQVFTIIGDKAYTITYGAHKEQFLDSLPTAQRMIDSFAANSTLSERGMNAGFETAKEHFLDAWNQTGFHSAFDTYVYSPPSGYGLYDERASNRFHPGETLILYVEPVGFSHKLVSDESSSGNETLYLMNFTADIMIHDKQGQELANIQNIPVSQVISHRQNTELFLMLTLTQESPFPPGDYTVTYVITDEPSGESFEIVKDVTITQGDNITGSA